MISPPNPRTRSTTESKSLVILVDVKVAHFFLLGLAGRDRTQRRAAKESHFDVLRKAMDAEEPALAFDSVLLWFQVDGPSKQID
jgi:hypothetical protein